MAQFYEQLNDKLIDFIREQHVYFVATSAKEGRVNCSPKGMDTLRVLSAKTVAYLDLTGSGAETAAHVRANGRLTVMLCSFGEKPLILRMYGRGEIVLPTDPAWADLKPNFPDIPGQRQIVVLHIESGQTSCGFSIPKMEFVEERKELVTWAEKKGARRTSRISRKEKPPEHRRVADGSRLNQRCVLQRIDCHTSVARTSLRA